MTVSWVHTCWEIISLSNEASAFVVYTYLITFSGYGHVLLLARFSLVHLSRPFTLPQQTSTLRSSQLRNIWANAAKISKDLLSGTAAARLDRNGPSIVIDNGISMEIHQNDTCFQTHLPILAHLRGIAAGGSWMRCTKAKKKNYFRVSSFVGKHPKETVEIKILGGNLTALQVLRSKP